MCVAVTVACLAMLTLTQRVLIAQDGLAINDLQRRMQAEKVSNQRLEMALFAQQSPARIRRQAQARLKMVEPQKVSYMQIPQVKPSKVPQRASVVTPRRVSKAEGQRGNQGVLETVLEKVTRQVQLLPLGNVGIFANQ